MFRATGWSLEDAPDGTPGVRAPRGAYAAGSALGDSSREWLAIVRRFEFDHGRMTMSVVVRDDARGGALTVFCKGAFETIGKRCVGGAHSASGQGDAASSPDHARCAQLPADFAEAARAHALAGCYVLAIAARELPPEVDAKALAAMTRDDVEQELRFLGLVLFRNELKPDTADAIDELKRGDCRALMITGDNAQCGNYIARASRMVRADAAVLLAEPDTAAAARGGAVAPPPSPATAASRAGLPASDAEAGGAGGAGVEDGVRWSTMGEPDAPRLTTDEVDRPI